MKRRLVWAFMALPLFAACDSDDKINIDDENESYVEVTMQNIADTWYYTYNYNQNDKIDSETFIIEPDGHYNYTAVFSSLYQGQYKPNFQENEEGDYTLMDGFLIDHVALSRQRRCVVSDDIEKARWDTLEIRINHVDTVRVSLVCGGSVMVHEYLKSPVTPTSQDLDHMFMYYRKGASNLPSNKSSLNGTWYAKDKSDTISYAVRFSGDYVEVYEHSYYVYKYKGVYTYKDGMVSVGPTTLYVSRDSKGNPFFNPGAPFDVEWKEANPNINYNRYAKGISFGFITNGRTAYARSDIKCLSFTKQ